MMIVYLWLVILFLVICSLIVIIFFCVLVFPSLSLSLFPLSLFLCLSCCGQVGAGLFPVLVVGAGLFPLDLACISLSILARFSQVIRFKQAFKAVW